jgi:hypothetical protein
MLDFAFGFWKTKSKREIVEAKTHNRKSKNSKLRQRRGEIEIISPFCASTFSGFRLSLIRVFCLHLRKQEGGRVVKALGIKTTMSTPLWVRSSCVSRFQGTFRSSGFRRFSRLEYRAPPHTRLVTLREPYIYKRSFISPSENLPLSLPYLHIRVVSSTYD